MTLRNQERNLIEASPLFKAIHKYDLKAVQKELEKEVNLEQTDSEGQTPLFLSLSLRHFKIAQVLLEAGADPSFLTQHWISHLIYRRESAIVSLIIETGIDVNQRLEEDDEETFLIGAALVGDINIVKKLVEYGADPNIVSRKNDFALLNAACKGWQEIYDYLAPLTSPDLRAIAEKFLPSGLVYRKRADNTLVKQLIEGVTIRDLEIVLAAIRDGANVNEFEQGGNTALLIAANWGCVPVVCVLIEAGADVNLGREWDGETPLIAAASRTNLIKDKIDTGGSPSMTAAAQTNLTKRPVDTGIMDQIEVIRILIEAGADVNAQDDEGWAALIAAANAGSSEAVELLLKAGADVNHQTEDGETALSRAKEAGSLGVVRVLLDAGAVEK